MNKPATILVVNAGSSSVKISVLDSDDSIVDSSELPARYGIFDRKKLISKIRNLGPVDAVGHRIVHGGQYFTGPTLITDDVIRRIEALSALAPLHQSSGLAGIDAALEAVPDAPQVACFDTAFHSRMPASSANYAVPQQWRDEFGVRRYGFHGLSHAYASRRASEILQLPQARTVVCHLGSGASLAAVHNGWSVDTTMGFTPLEGLVMATRSGSVDPGLVLWLQEQHGLSTKDVSQALEQHSGLLGLAGTADMKAVLAGEKDGDANCQLALDIYLHSLTAGIAAMAATMQGIDVLVFTGGVGERSAEIRQRASQQLEFLGIAVDNVRNAQATGDADITEHGSAIATLVITAREDRQIAYEIRKYL